MMTLHWLTTIGSVLAMAALHGVIRAAMAHPELGAVLLMIVVVAWRIG